MEIICTQCGARLPENARYCNNCGNLLSSSTSGSVPYSPAPGSASTSNQQNGGGSRPPLREQIAQQPPARPLRHSSPDHSPSWMNELERSGQGKTQADPLRMKRTMESEREQQTTGAAVRELRELRVKVWPQEDSAESMQSEREQKSAGSPRSETGPASIGTALDDLPTRPLVANPHTPAGQQAVSSPVASRQQESSVDDVEQLDTTPLLAPETGKSGPVPLSGNVPVIHAGQVEQRVQQAAERGDSRSRPSPNPSQRETPPARPVVRSQSAPNRFAQQPISPLPPAPPGSPLPPQAPTHQEGRPAPVMASPGVERTGRAHRAKRSGRVPVMALLAALALLIVGGLATWLIGFHPFAVPAVTQPRQAFSNTQLGLSVLYPSGWSAKVNTGKGTVTFSDSSNTGQVRIVVSATASDLNQTLSKEESQLGMTGVRPESAVSFAGTSWQQVQGSVQVSGANYTAVLLAAVHGSHTYTIIQMAPQATYSDEDHLIFSSMRSSFQFLP